jgi:hypothetical protein
MLQESVNNYQRENAEKIGPDCMKKLHSSTGGKVQRTHLD